MLSHVPSGKKEQGQQKCVKSDWAAKLATCAVWFATGYMWSRRRVELCRVGNSAKQALSEQVIRLVLHTLHHHGLANGFPHIAVMATHLNLCPTILFTTNICSKSCPSIHACCLTYRVKMKSEIGFMWNELHVFFALPLKAKLARPDFEIKWNGD